LLDIVEQMLKFPSSTVCRHYVAGSLLNELELCGLPVTSEFKDLVKATVQCDDSQALASLKQVREDRFFH
jgi:hypothetical protein